MEETFKTLLEIFRTMEKNVKLNIFSPVKCTEGMTLSAVEENLKRGCYADNYWLFIEHVSKAFQHIYDNFGSRSKIYRTCNEIEGVFNAEINEAMKRAGYCCGKYREMHTRKIECSAKKKCQMKDNSKYFIYDVLSFCEPCFIKLPDDQVFMVNDSNVKATKNDFKCCTFIRDEPERFIKCLKCKRLQHERCVLHIEELDIPFYCKSCSMADKIEPFKLSSEEIMPTTEFDEFLEKYLRDQNIKENISIRLVSSCENEFTPNELIAKYSEELQMYEKISYHNCVVLAFTKLEDDSEVCFFGVYFQLYGNSNCPQANRNSIYLSYIDSVKLPVFSDRTAVYHSILFGIFEYFKQKNFQRVYVWSCPPKVDYDYIFFVKPSSMRIPTRKRLSDWYKAFMKLAAENKVIESYSGTKQQNWNDFTNIPIFYEDMWSTRIEECIKDVEKKHSKNPYQNVNDLKKAVNELMKVQINGFNDDYFILKLKTKDNAETSFPLHVNGWWISDRNDIADMMSEFKLHHSNKRQVKYSTFMLLYRYALENATCRKCKKISLFGLNPLLLCALCTECHQKFSENDNNDVDLALPNQNIPVFDLTGDDYDMKDVDLIEGDEIIDLTGYYRQNIRRLDVIDLCH